MTIAAVLFDLDGLLVDSERLWDEAKRRAFAPLSIEFDDSMQAETTGLRQIDMVKYWFGKHPWSGPSIEQVAGDVVDELCSLIQLNGISTKAGAKQAVQFCLDSGLALAVVSSSPLAVIMQALATTGLGQQIPWVYSAEDDTYGKPNPAVYLRAARDLDVNPSTCVVVEDSLTGVIAGKAARMTVVAVPSDTDRENSAFAIANYQLSSLDEFPHALGELLTRD